jgi:signal transduction histidine kinase/transcriptional regulator with GAF, ATPase, and Fis domain/ActR/RegA family two-component response regulator
MFVKSMNGKEAGSAEEERLTTELADLERLHALSMRLMGQSDLATMLHEVLIAVAALLRADKANIQIYEGQDYSLKCISVIGLDQDFANRFSSVDARRGTVCAAALKLGERVIIENLSTHPDFTELARFTAPYGIRAAQSTPLFGSDGKISGMLTTYFNQPHRPSEYELRLLDLYAQQAARQIERARSEERLRQSEARLAMELATARQLQEISTQLIQSDNVDSLYQQILDAAITIMGSNMASMQVLTQGKLRLLAWKGFHPASAALWERVDVDSGSSCGAALSTGQRVIVPDIEKCDFIIGMPSFDAYCKSGIRAMQSTPLLSRSGRMLGMISTHWREPRQPTEHDLGLLDVLARQAADLIERAQAEEALSQSKRQLQMALSAGKFGHWQLDLSDLSMTSSSQCKANFGRGADEPFTYEMFRATIHPDDRAMVEVAVDRAIRERGDYEADYRCLWPDGSIHWINARGRVLDNGGHRATPTQMIGVTLDITERKQTEALLAGQKRVLEMLTTGAALSEVLATLIRTIEAQSEGLLGSILIRQPDSNCFYMGVAPSLPGSYTEALQQAPISPPYLGPCGRASHLGEIITTIDIATDQRWSKEWRDLVLGLGLHVCYSSPIFASDGKILGSFGTYYRNLRDPKPPNSQLLEIATHLAGIAIERRQAEKAQQEYNRRKDEFLAMLAHELRNPLAPILNAVQLLRLKEGNGEAIHSVSEIMERQIGQMVRLVDDLLDVSRITRGKIELRRERVELASAVNRALETIRPLLQSLNHGLTITLPPQPIYLHGDLARLTQIIGNLLNNACKFTSKSGQIWLTVECESEQEAIIRVRDTGIGIAADQLSRIFELFTQVDTSLERTHHGLGIGLTLVKNLAEMHGGAVEVHSDGHGQGSEFVVRLPLLVDTPKSLLPEPTLIKRAATTGYRILVVDDNRDAAVSLAMWLKLIGNETQIAHDGLAAVEAAAAFKPDVLLLDIGLPKINGYDVARKVREQSWGKKALLVALTGWGQDEDREKSREAGFNHHMVKPVDHDALTKLLAKVDSS